MRCGKKKQSREASNLTPSFDHEGCISAPMLHMPVKRRNSTDEVWLRSQKGPWFIFQALG